MTSDPKVPYWWRGHRLAAIVGRDSHHWECRYCRDVTVCWKTPARDCPGETIERRTFADAAGGDA